MTNAPLAAAVLRILHSATRKRGVKIAEKTFEPQLFSDEVASLMPELSPDGYLIGESFEWIE
jgi:hypothetical protein